MTGATDAPSSQSGHPTTTSRQCLICSEHVAVYTCPRCAIPTCSLPCSVAHKSSTGCSGVRDKTKFVPINGYTYGTMMDDYVFLEDMSKKVSDWGRDIVRGGYETIQSRRGRGGRMGRGYKPRDGISGKKRDMLRSQLELRDVEIDLLPTGMERRTRNQSAWDQKKRTAFLTVEYIIHPPLVTDASTSDTQEPYTFLTHRNNFSFSLRDLFQSQVLQRTKGKARADLPSWVKNLALPHPDIPDAFTPPQFLIRAPLGLLSGQSEKFGFVRLDGERKLSALLRNKQIVEFPTIEVWEEGAFRGVLLDDAGTIESQGGQRPEKRRKLDVTKGRAAITGLLGGYGSEDDEEVETALTRLGDYEGSDTENEQSTMSEDEDTDESAEDDDEDEGELDTAVDPATLLAMVQEVQRQHGEDGEYDEVDWGSRTTIVDPGWDMTN